MLRYIDEINFIKYWKSLVCDGASENSNERVPGGVQGVIVNKDWGGGRGRRSEL